MDTKTVIYFVGATLVLAVLGIVALAATGERPIPDVLQNIAVGCLTGLVGLLVPSRPTRSERGHVDLSAAILIGVLAIVVLALLGYFR